MSKEKDYKFIKDFNKITIKGICEELKVHRGNLLIGKSSEETTKRVAESLRKKIIKLLEE